MSFGQRLGELRKDHQQTQQGLADLLHVSKFTVSSWEQDRSCPPVQMVKQICQLYDISADYLLELIDYDPGYEHNRRYLRYSEEEIEKLKEYEQFVLFQRRNKKASKE